MFHLRKWYLDCTTPEGAAVIGYWARARWGALRLSYAGVLRIDPGGVVQRSTWRAGSEPIASGGAIAWKAPGLRVAGTWSVLDSSTSRTLLETDAGSVRWSCFAPRAACALDIDGTTVGGLGYGELLDMTIAPWKLPIRELRWGRWLADDTSIVWIDWRGGHPLSLVLERGSEVPGRVEDDGVAFGDGRRLTLEPGRIIRDGELGATVLRSIPGIRDALPAAVLRTRERKWLSRGMLNGMTGWAIHEHVTFGD